MSPVSRYEIITIKKEGPWIFRSLWCVFLQHREEDGILLNLLLWQHRTAHCFMPLTLGAGCEHTYIFAFSDLVARKLAEILLLAMGVAQPCCDGCSCYLCLLKMGLAEVGRDLRKSSGLTPMVKQVHPTNLPRTMSRQVLRGGVPRRETPQPLWATSASASSPAQ